MGGVDRVGAKSVPVLEVEVKGKVEIGGRTVAALTAPQRRAFPGGHAVQRLGATEQVRPVVAGANRGGARFRGRRDAAASPVSTQRAAGLAGSRELNVGSTSPSQLSRLGSIASQTGHRVLYIIFHFKEALQ